MQVLSELFSSFPYARNPFSCYSHLSWAILSFISSIFLYRITRHNFSQLFSVSIWLASGIILFSVSASYHGVTTPEYLETLRRADHAAIFLLIAGTYTPICVVALQNDKGVMLLIAVWALAFLGIGQKTTLPFSSESMDAIQYVLLGSLILVKRRSLQIYSGHGFPLLLLGGLFYIVSALVYALEWPSLYSGFNFHDLMHVFVILGYTTHAYFIVFFILPTRVTQQLTPA